jgi:hypothetical protein
MIIDAENLECECVWDEALKPIGEGTWEKEPFSSWWERCKGRGASSSRSWAVRRRGRW